MMRQNARKVLAALSERERELRSRSLGAKMWDMPGFRAARTIMVYLATPEEVDLSSLIEKAAAAGKRICVPRMDWAARLMSPLIVDWNAMKTEVREHGIAEPVGGASAKLESLDLVLVPGLAFDESGHRLGRGAGFYDRFLEAFRARRGPEAVALGVCFEAQLVGEIPSEPHDERLDGIVTEKRVLLCRKKPRRADKKLSRNDQ
ncbi:MAG: 5-formyltetrahydrofolate cyclo-ligase [Phycisphaerae bacterium]|nr:5-formyltetrahydrofolate cyclo-ligase [Phycisphaerae bacterium]